MKRFTLEDKTLTSQQNFGSIYSCHVIPRLQSSFRFTMSSVVCKREEVEKLVETGGNCLEFLLWD